MQNVFCEYMPRTDIAHIVPATRTGYNENRNVIKIKAYYNIGRGIFLVVTPCELYVADGYKMESTMMMQGYGATVLRLARRSPKKEEEVRAILESNKQGIADAMQRDTAQRVADGARTTTPDETSTLIHSLFTF